MMHELGPEELLTEQIEYYRARAPEYDDWWYRRGRYDRGEAANRRWRSEIARVHAALGAFAPHGEVLELAAGTGTWTGLLAGYADRVTAVDASPEALAINRAKFESSVTRVRFVEADLFMWEPDRRYDVVSFTFWLSHVPEAWFEHFWGLVDAALAPDGRFFLVDNAPPRDDLPAGDGSFPRDDLTLTGLEGVTDLGKGTTVRRLGDGREFQIVKVFRPPEQLESRLVELGWSARVGATEWAFIYGHGRRRTT